MRMERQADNHGMIVIFAFVADSQKNKIDRLEKKFAGFDVAEKEANCGLAALWSHRRSNTA